jgi:hypothetical protein
VSSRYGGSHGGVGLWPGAGVGICRGAKFWPIGDAHDLVFVENEIGGGENNPGVFVEETARDIYLADNEFTACSAEVAAGAVSLAGAAPEIECGYGEWTESIYRHLSADWAMID